MKRNSFFGRNVEYFNGTQWKKISEYSKGEKILIYNLDGTAELTQPIKYIKKKTNGMNTITHNQLLNVTVSDEALFVAKYRSEDKFNHGWTMFTFKEAMIGNYSLFSHALLINTFKYNTNTNSMLSLNNLNIMIYSIIYGTITNDIAHMSEKITYKLGLKQMLAKSHIKYNTKKGIVSYRLPRGEQIFYESILHFSQEEVIYMVDMIDRLMDNATKVELVNPNEKTGEFLQLLYARYGKRCSIKPYGILKHNRRVTGLDPYKMSYYHADDEKMQYSFTTKTGYIIIRSNGLIFVMGDYKK